MHVLSRSTLRLFSKNCRQTGVAWLKWIIAIFISFRNEAAIRPIVHYDSTVVSSLLWISADTSSKDDLE